MASVSISISDENLLRAILKRQDYKEARNTSDWYLNAVREYIANHPEGAEVKPEVEK